MKVLKDEDYFVIEPCASCEKHYIEDIWWEDCCDMKRCIHAEEYKKARRGDADDDGRSNKAL